jgi:hypothetical protein
MAWISKLPKTYGKEQVGLTWADATNRKDFVCKAMKSVRMPSTAFERVLGEVQDAELEPYALTDL